MRKIFLVMSALALTAQMAAAEQVVLKNGRVLEGRIASQSDKYITVDVAGVSHTYKMEDVAVIGEVAQTPPSDLPPAVEAAPVAQEVVEMPAVEPPQEMAVEAFAPAEEPETPEIPEMPEAIEAPEMIEAAEVIETPEVPESPEAVEAPEAPEVPEAMEMPQLEPLPAQEIDLMEDVLEEDIEGEAVLEEIAPEEIGTVEGSLTTGGTTTVEGTAAAVEESDMKEALQAPEIMEEQMEQVSEIVDEDAGQAEEMGELEAPGDPEADESMSH